MSKRIISRDKKFFTVNILIVYLMCTLYVSTKVYSQNKPMLKIDTSIKSVNYYEFFEITRYIKLETNSKSLVNQIFSIKSRNDTIFTFSSKRVYLWDFSGKFIRSIGAVGHGSSEMLLPSDFAISPKGNQIGIWDNMLRSLFIYSMNGKFIKKITPGLKEITNFEWTNSNQLIFCSQYVSQNDKHFSFYLTDSEGKFIKSFLPYDPDNESFRFINYSHFPKSGNSQFVWTDFDQTIYEFKANSVTPTIRYEFDKGNLHSEDLGPFKGDTRKLVDYMSDKGYYQLISFNDLCNFYSFTYTNVKKICTNIISRDGVKQYRIQHSSESIDPLSNFMPIFIINNELVCIVEPYLLKTKWKQTLPQMKQRMGASGVLLDKLSKELKDEDNPVLLFLKPKCL